MNQFGVGNSLVQASSTECQKPRSNQTAFSEFFFLKTATFRCVQKMAQITFVKRLKIKSKNSLKGGTVHKNNEINGEY